MVKSNDSGIRYAGLLPYCADMKQTGIYLIKIESKNLDSKPHYDIIVVATIISTRLRPSYD
jgi:hypothetical protein